MTKKYGFIKLLSIIVLFFLAIWGSYRDSVSANIAVGSVLINEFVAAPGTLQVTEWVELYNTTNTNIDISGCWIDDIAGGASPMQIPAGTIIPSHGFYTMNFNSVFNNTGDSVRLLSTDQATELDSFTYSSATTDKSWRRQTDGGVWANVQGSPTKGSSNGGTVGTGTWTPGQVEIHVLDVEQSESILIVGPTGRTLLIGPGERVYNTNEAATRVAAKIREITGAYHVNYIMPSHWHSDHMGYVGIGGIWSLLEEQNITADAIIDRDGGTWVDANNDNVCDPDNEVVWHNAGTVSGTARNWVCWATNPATRGGSIRQLAQLGSTTQIDLGISNGVIAKIVQVDANGVKMADGVTPVAGNHVADALPPSENDYSITVWLKWGKFDFVAGGDTDGEYNVSSFDYSYNDVETNVANRINQQVEIVMVNHHGSEHSTNQNYLNKLNPAVAIFTVGDNSFGHPTQAVLDRLNNNGTAMYLTNLGDPARNYYNATIANSDVVVKVANGVNYSVNGNPYIASDPTITTNVVINEIAWSGSLATPNDEWIELYNPSSSSVSLSGWKIIDDNGAQTYNLSGSIPAGGYYLIERAQTSTTVIADLVMSNLSLANTGDKLLLQDSGGNTIDVVNSTDGPWYAGDNSSAHRTMERISATVSGNLASNWQSNNGVTRNGNDSLNNPINGTPKAKNSVTP